MRGVFFSVSLATKAFNLYLKACELGLPRGWLGWMQFHQTILVGPASLEETGSWGWAWSWPLALPLTLALPLGCAFPLSCPLAMADLTLALIVDFSSQMLPSAKGRLPLDCCLSHYTLAIDVWSCKDGKQAELVTISHQEICSLTRQATGKQQTSFQNIIRIN